MIGTILPVGSIPFMFSDFDRAGALNSSEEALLMRELCRRTAGEVATATAAIALANTARSAITRLRQVDDALARLRGFGELNRLLARPLPARVELAGLLETMCATIGRGGREGAAIHIELALREAWLTGPAARRVLVVAAGLIEESLGAAPGRSAGWLRVRLTPRGHEVSLTVEDGGPGPRLPARGAERAEGLEIVADLVGRAAGTMTMVTGRRGTRMTVAMPTGLEAGDDDVLF